MMANSWKHFIKRTLWTNSFSFEYKWLNCLLNKSVKYIALFRGKATSVLAGFLCVLYPGGIGIWRCWVLRTEENGRNEEKPSEQGHEPTTNSTHTWRWNQTRATLARSERSHHCAICAPITAAKLYHAGTQKPNLCLQYIFLLEQPSKSKRSWKFLFGNA